MQNTSFLWNKKNLKTKLTVLTHLKYIINLQQVESEKGLSNQYLNFNLS
jgi:hypothetical protein